MYLNVPSLDPESLARGLRALWGPAELKRWPAGALRDVEIPDAAKQLLTRTGLPDIWPGSVRFPREEGPLPRLDAVHPHYRVIGVEPERWTPQWIPCMCLDERRGGCVLWVPRSRVRHEPRRTYLVYHEQPDGPEELINASVAQLAAFLVVHRKLWNRTEALLERLPDRPSPRELEEYEAQVLPLLEQAGREMRRLDPEAMRDEREGWWPVILSEFRDHGMWG